jgi:hypothetical protein
VTAAMEELRERIAKSIIGAGHPSEGQMMSARRMADRVIKELNLHTEGRQLSDGEGGMSTNWKTGETTIHSKPCTLQIRWVTNWVNDNNMTLPLNAYIPTP